jgi:hypothetical protein
MVTSQIMESLPYMSLPKFMDRLIDIRGENQDSSINYTMILLSTTIIESVLFDLLNLTLENSHPNNKLLERIVINQLNRLDKASWNDSLQLVEIVYGKKLNTCVDPELWKAIGLLFTYRNLLIHGKPIAVESHQNGPLVESEYLGQFNQIHSFLVEKGILQKKETGILLNTVTNFFWNCTKRFVLMVSEELKDRDNVVVSRSLQSLIK